MAYSYQTESHAPFPTTQATESHAEVVAVGGPGAGTPEDLNAVAWHGDKTRSLHASLLKEIQLHRRATIPRSPVIAIDEHGILAFWIANHSDSGKGAGNIALTI
jgi:hypothetical protein